jgi:hypothetical protein
MSGLEVIGVVLGLYPIVISLANGYLHWKGSDAELHRALMVASTVFDNTVNHLLASTVSPQEVQRLPSSQREIDQTIWKDPVLQQTLRDRIGEQKLSLALVHLSEIKTLLVRVKTELTTMSRGGVRAKVKVTWAQMPNSGINERMKRVRKLNDDLCRLLNDRPFTWSHQQATSSDTTPTISVGITQTGVPRASEFFEAIKETYTCRCAQPHAIGLGCSCTMCTRPFSEKLDLHAADEWQFCLTLNPPGLDALATHATILLQSIPDTHTNASPSTRNICSWVADMAASEARVSEIVLPTTKSKDKKLHRMRVSKMDGGADTKQLPTIKSFDELRGDHSLSTKYRLEVAIRLSLAILQLCKTPWVSQYWTWNDVCVTRMQVSIPDDLETEKDSSRDDDGPERAESSVLFILNRRIYSAVYDGETASTAPTIVAVPRAVDILDEEPHMTKLGLALIELALRRSIQDLREDVGYHDMDVPENIADICTARKLVMDKKIREEVGENYERVVDLCLGRRYVDSLGQTRSVVSKHESFLSSFRDNIVRPLYQMWKSH